MKRIFIFCLFLAILSSCATQRRCNRFFPPSIDTVKITTTRDSISVRDTTIFIHLPQIIKTDSILIPCPPTPLTYIPDTAKSETNYAIAKAWFDYPNIQLSLKQKSEFQITLDNAIKEMWHWKNEYMKVSSVIKEKYIPGFYKFCTFAFIGIILAIIGYIAFRLFVLKK